MQHHGAMLVARHGAHGRCSDAHGRRRDGERDSDEGDESDEGTTSHPTLLSIHVSRSADTLVVDRDQDVNAGRASDGDGGEDVVMGGGDAATAAFLESIPSARRRRDAATLLDLMRRVTGLEPSFRGKMVGFGTYHYHYASGREGDAPAAGFAARGDSTVVYLSDGVDAHTTELERLGPHRTGVGCLYLKDLEAVDLGVLESIVASSYRTLTAGIFPGLARDEGPGS
jgi:hypothetical protein